MLALLLAVTLYLAYGTTPTRQAGGVDTAAPVTEASTAEATGDAAAETNMAAATPEGQPAPAAAPADETAAATSAEQNESPMPDSAATPDQTASSESGNTDTSRPSTAATPAETATEPTTPEKSTRLAESEPVPVPAQSEQETPDNGTDKPASQSESNAKSTDETTTSAPPPEVEASSADTADDSTDRSTNTNASRQNEATQPAVSAPQQENAAAATDKKANGALQPGLLFDPAKLEPRAILSRFNSAGEALREARTATRAGNYQWAAAIYASLLHFYPRADLAGELGNLFWRIGDKAWAHRAWRYAAQLLIREGRIDTARRFAENIAGIDPALSREIKAHLPAEKSAQRTTPQN
ncbi:hypothetical protein [Sulfurivirga sp.]|uniref:hypothetical protein n=1 Tax=Sulfurivirga sp. TaxID=2614236 RepID=UPI0025DB1B15|nr:hypothetical protein [Sulfurivirga sp.]